MCFRSLLSSGSNLHELFFQLHEKKMCQLIKTSSDWLMLRCFPSTLIGTETPRRVAPASCLASSWLLLLLCLCVQHVSVVFVVIYDPSVFLGDCCEFVRCFLVLFKRPQGKCQPVRGFRRLVGGLIHRGHLFNQVKAAFVCSHCCQRWFRGMNQSLPAVLGVMTFPRQWLNSRN